MSRVTVSGPCCERGRVESRCSRIYATSVWPVLTTQPGRHSTLLRLTFAAVTHTTSCNDVRTLLRAMACVAHGVRCILLVRAACLAGPDVVAATVRTLSRDRTPYLLSISLTTKPLFSIVLDEVACTAPASVVSSLRQAQLVHSGSVWLGVGCVGCDSCFITTS